MMMMMMFGLEGQQSPRREYLSMGYRLQLSAGIYGRERFSKKIYRKLVLLLRGRTSATRYKEARARAAEREELQTQRAPLHIHLCPAATRDVSDTSSYYAVLMKLVFTAVPSGKLPGTSETLGFSAPA